MRGLRPAVAVAAILGASLLFASSLADETSSAPTARVEVDPVEATVGDRVGMTLVVSVPEDTRFDPPTMGPAMGPFTVVEGSWTGPVPEESGQIWTWSGRLSAFRTGDLEIPSVRIVVRGDDDEPHSVVTDPVAVRILSVLDPEDTEDSSAPIADLKAPASIPPNYRPLLVATGVFALLLLGAAILWWLHRRYAARVAAVPAPDDPFHRTPPHVWAYAELQKLLDRRLAEEGRVLEFYDELSRILKRYLGGRYRVDLMERTTSEVPPQLEQAGSPSQAIRDVELLLAESDLVRFAREAVEPSACRKAIESAYDIVDATRPADAEPVEAEKGAA